MVSLVLHCLRTSSALDPHWLGTGFAEPRKLSHAAEMFWKELTGPEGNFGGASVNETRNNKVPTIQLFRSDFYCTDEILL